jgi:hypothetical protein
MNRITIKLNNDFTTKNASNVAMQDVAFFLISDVFHEDLTFRNWLLDEAIDTMEGNYFLLIKKGQETFMNCKYNEDFYVEASKLPTLALVDLLEQWYIICKMNPDEVIITYDQDKFHVEGKIIHKQAQETVHENCIKLKKARGA